MGSSCLAWIRWDTDFDPRTERFYKPGEATIPPSEPLDEGLKKNWKLYWGVC